MPDVHVLLRELILDFTNDKELGYNSCMARSYIQIHFLVVILLMLSIKAANSIEHAAAYKRFSMPGPFSFELLEVLDGDTFRVRIPIWLDQQVVVKIRLRGIDTPELNGKCRFEKNLAQQAKAFTANWLAQESLELVNVSYGNYPGRVLAHAQTKSGATLSGALLAARLAQPYKGKRGQWCS